MSPMLHIFLFLMMIGGAVALDSTKAQNNPP